MEFVTAPPRYESFRQKVARLSLAAIYLSAGFLHVMLPGPFLSILPNWVPEPQFTIFATGLCEIAGAIGLCTALDGCSGALARGKIERLMSQR